MTQKLQNEQNTLKVHGSLLLAALFYGASYSIAQQIMPRLIAPEPFILLRVWISCAVFWAVYALQPSKLRKTLHKPTGPEHLRLMACAVFGVAGNMLLFFKGLAISSPVSAAVIMITTPIFILAFALLFLKEKAGLLKIGGMLVGALGAALLIYSADTVGSAGNRANTVAGNLMVLVNALFFAVYLIMVKPLLIRFETLQLMRWLFLYGSILVTPFGWAELSSIEWGLFTSSDWMSFWFIILGISVGAYWLNAWSLKHTRATVVGSYIYLQPLLAALFGLFWGEKIHPMQIIFGSLVFAGVFMVGRARK
jgi:drug/metabolite transporter (DMT)-like permease